MAPFVTTNNIGTPGQARWVQNHQPHQLQAMNVSVNATDTYWTWKISTGMRVCGGFGVFWGICWTYDDVGYVRRHDAAHCESEAARCTYVKCNGGGEKANWVTGKVTGQHDSRKPKTTVGQETLMESWQIFLGLHNISAKKGFSSIWFGCELNVNCSGLKIQLIMVWFLKGGTK